MTGSGFGRRGGSAGPGTGVLALDDGRERALVGRGCAERLRRLASSSCRRSKSSFFSSRCRDKRQQRHPCLPNAAPTLNPPWKSRIFVWRGPQVAPGSHQGIWPIRIRPDQLHHVSVMCTYPRVGRAFLRHPYIPQAIFSKIGHCSFHQRVGKNVVQTPGE